MRFFICFLGSILLMGVFAPVRAQTLPIGVTTRSGDSTVKGAAANDTSTTKTTTPLTKRTVMGTILNERSRGVSGATVQLIIGKDTLSTRSTNGMYTFSDVPSAEFLITVRAMGFDSYARKYYNNDTKPMIFLPTIQLGVNVERLEEVTVTRQRGSVVKGDTTEYWASDYIVRDFARLKDLLERMEGVRVDADGNVFHNGVEVKKALFNNQDYFSGSVQEIIRELPADIVDRVQFIDRAPDGINAPQVDTDSTVRVMNVVSKRDKSAGKMINTMAELGTEKRQLYNAGLRRIDGPKQTSINASFKSSIPGVSNDRRPGSIGENSGSMMFGGGGGITLDGIVVRGGGMALGLGGGGSGGGSSSGSGGFAEAASLNLSHNVPTKKGVISPSYGFNYDNDGNETRGESEQFFEAGRILSSTYSESFTSNNSHNLRIGFSPNQGAVMIWGGMAGGPSSVTVVRGGNMGTGSPVIMGGPAGSQAAQKPKPVVNANFGLNRRGGESSATSLEQKAGLVNSLERQLSFGDDQNTNGNANIMMQIPISSWKTFLSLDLSSNFSDRKSDQNTQYGVYALDAGSTLQLIRPEDFNWEQMHADSLLYQQRHQNSEGLSAQLTARLGLTLSPKLRISTSLGLNRGYNLNQTLVDQSTDGIQYAPNSDFDIYNLNQSFQVPLSITPEYQVTKWARVSFGATATSYHRWGKWAPNSKQVSRSEMLWQPAAALHLSSPKVGYAQFRVASSTTLVPLDNFNPDTIYSSPFSLRVGNPDLKPEQRHTYKLSFNRNFKKIGLQLNYFSTISLNKRSITTDRFVQIDSLTQVMTTIMRSINIKGGSSQMHRLGFSKELWKASVILKYDVGFNHSKTPYLSEGRLQHSENKQQSHELSMPIRPFKWLDLSWRVMYNYTESFNSLALTGSGFDTQHQFATQGRFHVFLPQDVRINLHATQSIYEMSTLLSHSKPFVLNANVEKRLLKDRSLILSAVVMDAFKQNWMSMRSPTAYGYTTQVSNPNSRYFLVQLSWQPQMWGKSSYDKGMGRRGDGSFILGY